MHAYWFQPDGETTSICSPLIINSVAWNYARVSLVLKQVQWIEEKTFKLSGTRPTNVFEDFSRDGLMLIFSPSFGLVAQFCDSGRQ
jgi:hypothetical protein